jgi:hypothetical protein
MGNLRKVLIAFLFAAPAFGANTDIGIGYVPAVPGNWPVSPVTYADALDKLAAGGAGVASVSASPPLSSSGGATPNITISQSTTTTNGYLSSTDWNTFNGKQAAGNYVTALTGDVSATGPGSVAATVNAVGGQTAANVASGAVAANAATAVNTTSTIVARDVSGNFAAGTITAALSGNATTATTAGNVSGTVLIGNGGTGQTTANAGFAALSPMTTDGDLTTRAGGVPVRFGIGSTNQVLTVVAGAPTWRAPTPFIVSSISSNTTAVSGNTYLCDTSAGAFNLTLPTPASGAYVFIKDKTGSFATNNLTIVRAGAEKIEGLAASKVARTAWGSIGLFSDGTDWYMGGF